MGMLTPLAGAMVTLNGACELTPSNKALTFVAPEAFAVASPEELMDATAELATVHVAEELTLAVVPLVYVAVAVNCCVAPMAKLAALGVTAMDLMELAPEETVRLIVV
jgi:hypothetical protein